MTPTDEQALSLARIETKLDVLIAANSDHESRLRVIESKGFVTSRQLWTSLVGAGTVVSAAVATVSLLLK